MSTSRSDPPGETPNEEARALRAEVERLAAELEAAHAEAARFESLAHEDALTGLLNRRGFLRDLTRAIAYRARYGASVALLFLDLDRFKPINDQFGHGTGDQVLRHVAGLLRGNVRASDSVGRLGGDEFALILWQIDLAAAERKARAIEDLIAASPFPLETTLSLAGSVGVTLLATDDTAEAALARADEAMYARKRARGALGASSGERGPGVAQAPV